MDSDIEQIHTLLVEANLPSSIEDLKNPTEEFVVSLINTFLRSFYIDVDAIDKPTLEQHTLMSHNGDNEIIGLINLHIAMVQICNRIYIKDFSITDIISPGSKRLRKQAKFLSNFILYATNKESDIQDKVNKIQDKAKKLHDVLEENKAVLTALNERALHVAKQLSLKERYIAEIKTVQSRVEENKKVEVELARRCVKIEKKKQKAMELVTSYKAEASKSSKTISELQSKIVKSPEKYEMRLNDLENQQTYKLKEREEIEEMFQEKKRLMEQLQSTSSFVCKQLEKSDEVQDINEKLKKIIAQEDGINKQVEILKVDIKEYETKLDSREEQNKENEVDALQAQYEKRLSPLCNSRSELLGKKKFLTQNLENLQVQYNEDSLKLREKQNIIKELEEETAAVIKSYQNLYDTEIVTEKSFVKNMDR